MNPESRVPSPDELAEASEIVRSVITPTALQHVTIAGVEMWLKRDDEQPTGSFKVRGALSALGHLAHHGNSESVVACSAGNHGLGIAYASQYFDIPATIVVPTTASPAKVEKLRSYPIELILHGTTYDEAEVFALDLAAQRKKRFISPYNNAWVIAGQATAAEETLAQLPELGTFMVAVGGGGLLSGSGLALRDSQAVALGVQVRQNAAFASLLRGDGIPALENTIADGCAGGIEVDSVTVAIARDLGLAITLVSEKETVAALVATYREFDIVVEGSAAVAIAQAMKEADAVRKPVAVLLCGSNIDSDLHKELVMVS